MRDQALTESKPVMHYSTFTGPSLENRVLTQASSHLTSTSAALRPSNLTSTTSSSPLLSTSSSLLSSFLISTENPQLKHNPLIASNLCSPYPLNPLIPRNASSAALCLPREEKTEKQESCSSEDLRSCNEELHEESFGHEEMELDDDSPSEMTVLDLRPIEEAKLDFNEEFQLVESRTDKQLEMLKEKKYKLLNLVCCSLVHKCSPPGQSDWDSSTTVWYQTIELGKEITLSDPEFLLKIAVYARQELNIRIMSNFLLALAAHLPNSKPHVRRYFCAAVQLPSDWLEVTRIYSTCFGKALPSCLKKALADKFQQFSEYQLAKYNTRKHRGKKGKKKPKAPDVSPEQWNQWARLIKTDVTTLKTFLNSKERKVVDKKQSQFNMKKLIKRLHIKQPAEFVMGILGKKYPADVRAFWRSGLSGVWQSERANQRMKLKQPETWETQLSLEGNKAATWEKLIDKNALPFMAMLRNLRNMITQGISYKHHKKILKRLNSKVAVIQSRQFPFRFLSAYKVIMELYKFVDDTAKPVLNNTKVLCGILKRVPRSRAFRRFDWEKLGRHGLRATLRVPFIRSAYKMKCKLQQKACQKKYNVELLQRYRQALEKAVQISCRYNIPPLSGHTLIILLDHWSNSSGWKEPDFCLPPEISENQEKDGLSASPKEAALLLALMISFCCERPQFLLANSGGVQELQLKSDNLLENVKSVMNELSEFSESDEKIPHSNFFSRLLEEKSKVDNIIIIGDSQVEWSTLELVKSFKKDLISEPLLVNILVAQNYKYADEHDPKTVSLFGFSEQMLRFISERGSSRFLDHVERIDKLHNIPPPTGPTAKSERSIDLMLLPAVPKLRWRGIRIFISSTFRDMHGERDMLVRNVFPELRRRAALLSLYLQEVDLRWGITEDESARAAEICLSEVCRSQLLLGVLGERYGLVPSRPLLPDLPQYSWLKSAPDGLSITEMEIRQFQAVYPDSSQSRMFFYFRAPHLLSSVPESWREDFVTESTENAAKIHKLKESIRSNCFRVTENYPREWGGVMDGKPYVKGLEHFAKAVLEDLWETLQKLSAEESDESNMASEIKEQEVHQAAQQQQFHGRAKLLNKAKEQVHECQQTGGVLLVEGAAGVGKTAFMAALARALQTPDKTRIPVCDVLSYSTAACQSASRVEPFLRCLVQWLRKKRDQEEALPFNILYRDLLSEWFCHLRMLKERSLAILIDGADLVHDAKGQGVSEWIPEHLPKGVCLVLSVAEDSALRTTMIKKKNTTSFPLKTLPLPDRREIVQKELSVYGKKLSDSAFNNQLQTLLMKKGAVNPLYLRLACEELRSYASFEKMKENLQALPVTLCELVQNGLIRLQSQYRRIRLDWALAALTISSTGLKERDLYFLLNLCTDLSMTSFPFTWQKVLKLARNPKSRLPMATFSQLARNLQSVIGSSLSLEPDDPLLLTNPDVRSAFEKLYLSDPEDRTRAHMILAAHLWVRSDPDGQDTFLHCDAEMLVQLPVNLMKCDQWQAMEILLSSYYFLYANVRHGLLHLLLENYVLFGKQNEGDSPLWNEPSDELQDCHSFLKRHAPLLSHWPALFVQQALNEPDNSAAHIWGKTTVEQGNIRAVRWMNNSGDLLEEDGELVSTFQWTPSCVAVSPAGVYIAVGTEQGSLHLLHANTNQEVKSLASNCDGISGCVFLNESVLCTTSYDGQVEVWDINSGCRTAQLNAHSNRITGCDVSSDRKHFATVSLDFALKVWNSKKGVQVASLQNPSPLNCVRFDPEGALLAVGCWDRTIRIWDWIKHENLVTLSGHEYSVRSVSFSPSPSLSLLCSGALDGEIRFWSISGSSCLWNIHGHRGSTEALEFLCNGEALLSAGHDGMVQLWSGGLACTVSKLGKEKNTTVSEDAALCVAVNGNYAAVGYHGNGIKLYNIQSGECVWTTKDLRVSLPCLKWLHTSSDFLLSGGLDQHLRLWRKHGQILKLTRVFGIQKRAILALDENPTLVASASDDFTIALWLKSDLTSDHSNEPKAMNILRGHNGGVTCLAFSPDGNHLLSGGKDQALMVWKVNSTPPVLSQSLPHCHGDWITGCAWTPLAVLSCSNDCRVRMWDIQNGSCIREIPTSSSLGALCCWEEYLMFGSADGLLTVWKSDLGVIAEIRAHHSRLHHTTIVSKPDLKENEHELLIATASDDGTVKIWKPLQVQHRSTLIGHSGGVQALVSGCSPQFLTVSKDRSLRSWSAYTERPATKMESVSALCFMQKQALLVCAYSTGRLDIWKHTSLLYSYKLIESCICALAEMPDRQVAVGCSDCTVSIWRIEKDLQECIIGLSMLSTYTLECSVKFLQYCTTLLGVCVNNTIIDVLSTVQEENREILTFKDIGRGLVVDMKGENSLWMALENDNKIQMAFLNPSEDPSVPLDSGFDYAEEDAMEVENHNNKEEETHNIRMYSITAFATDNDITVCGDSKGNIWFKQPPKWYLWSPRQPAHSDRIIVLRLTDSLIISASYDRTIKLWDRSTRKQMGLFVCAAPVEVLQVNPNDPSQLVCGDALGQIYFLSWRG